MLFHVSPAPRGRRDDSCQDGAIKTGFTGSPSICFAIPVEDETLIRVLGDGIPDEAQRQRVVDAIVSAQTRAEEQARKHKLGVMTSKTAFEPADAFGLAMVALAGTTVRFVLADPKALGFKNIQPVAVVAFPAALAVAALA